MKNVIKKGIALAGLAAIASCASVLYPFKQCKRGGNAWECKIAENWSEDWNNYYTRYGQVDSNCIIDVYKGKGYMAMVDRMCDGTVDEYMDNPNGGVEERSEFGNKYDARFAELKNKVGGYSWQHEAFYEVRGKEAVYKFYKD